jgi:hypothetical protein
MNASLKVVIVYIVCITNQIIIFGIWGFLGIGHEVSYRLTLFLTHISSTLKMEGTHSSEMSIYNKPTWCHIPEDCILQIIIHNNFCHPYERKKSALNYLVNRMNILNENRDEEMKAMWEVAVATNKLQPKFSPATHKRDKKTFTCYGSDTRTLIKLFKNTNIHGVS